MKVIGIVRNNGITGIEYGVIEVADPKCMPSQKKTKQPTKKIKKNKKHNSLKDTRIKTSVVEKETKTATQKPKRRYRLRATIVCSYNFKTTKKAVDLNKKRFKKTKTLFKKKQRDEKIALQNLALQILSLEPVADLIQGLKLENQKNR